MPTWIYAEIVRNVKIVSLAQSYPAGTVELFPLGANSDLSRNCTLRRNFPAGVKFWIYAEIVHYVEIILPVRNSPAGALEYFPFCANSDLLISCTLGKHFTSGTSEFISFRRQLGSYLGVQIPGTGDDGRRRRLAGGSGKS